MIKIPDEEFGLMAGLVKMDKIKGPATMEHGEYRILKDKFGNTRVEVKMSRFIKDGRTEVTVGKPNTFETFKKTRKDWVDASWIDQGNVMGSDVPRNYRSLIGVINQVALTVSHKEELTDVLISSLNIAVNVSYPEEHKKEIEGNRLSSLLLSEAGKWRVEGVIDETRPKTVPADSDLSHVLRHQK